MASNHTHDEICWEFIKYINFHIFTTNIRAFFLYKASLLDVSNTSITKMVLGLLLSSSCCPNMHVLAYHDHAGQGKVLHGSHSPQPCFPSARWSRPWWQRPAIATASPPLPPCHRTRFAWCHFMLELVKKVSNLIITLFAGNKSKDLKKYRKNEIE